MEWLSKWLLNLEKGDGETRKENGKQNIVRKKMDGDRMGILVIGWIWMRSGCDSYMIAGEDGEDGGWDGDGGGD